MKRTKRIPFFGMVVVGALSAFGGTWYADASKADDTGDGLSEATAKKYIQSAVNLAEASGETELKVVVLPGYYDDENETLKQFSSKDTQLSRVLISKPMTLSAKEGEKDRTHIVGRRGTGTYGLGDTSARCIALTSAATGTLIEGFTIRDGATKADALGGGVYCGANAYVCDCVISNCVAYNGGAIYGGHAARCFITMCDYTSGGGGYGVAHATGLSNCILFRNNTADIPSDAFIGANNPYVVNCHQFGCGHWRLPRVYAPVLGCIMLGNSAGGFSSVDEPGSDHYKAQHWGLVSNCVIYAAESKVTVSWALDGDTKVYFRGNNRYSAEFTNLVSTADWDFRALTTLEAEARADYSDLVLYTSGLPEKYRYKDYFGNTITPDANGKITAGAIQETVSADAFASDLLRFNTTVDSGHGKASSREEYTYARRTTWPAQIKVKSPVAVCNFCYSYSGASRYQYPDANNEAWITFPPNGTTVGVIGATVPSDTLYVDVNAESYDYDGKAAVYDAESGHGPKKTIQDAIDASTTDNTLVWVAPGTYSEGGGTVGGLKSRVAITDKMVYVRSTGGASVTTIQGAADSDSKIGGYGENATRCVGITQSGAVMGFTLTGGYTKAPRENDTDNASFGGCFYAKSGDTSFALVDCIISGNRAGQYGVSYMGAIYRSIIDDCDVYRTDSAGKSNAGEIRGTKIVSSIIRHNTDEGTTFRNNSVYINCTVDGGIGHSTGLFENNVSRINSALYYCGGNRQYHDYNYFWGNAVYGGSGTSFNNVLGDDDKTVLQYGVDYHYTTNRFVFANPSANDYRTYAGAGLAGTGADFSKGDYWYYAGGDINNNPLVIVNGRVTPGAVQTFHDQATYIGKIDDNMTLSRGISEEWNSLVPGDITIEATDAKRPFRVKVDGEWATWTNPFVIGADYIGKTVEPMYTTDWYVNANATTSGNGMAPEQAVKTLKEAMELPTKSGDTVHAARGDYNSGVMRPDPALTRAFTGWNSRNQIVELDSRVVITNAITLVADEGRDVTFITGKAADDPDASYGLGVGAVRCALITDYATIKDFTIRNGYTLSRDQTGGNAENDDDAHGGALLSTCGGGGGKLDGCIIENCASEVGTCNYYGTLNNCIVRNCIACAKGCATFVGYIYGSYFNNLRSNGEAIYCYRGMKNCTVGPDVKKLNGDDLTAVAVANDNLDATKVVNTLSLAKGYFNPNSHDGSIINCRLMADDRYVSHPEYLGTGTELFDTLADAKVDDDCVGVPGSGSSVLGTADVELTDFSVIGWTDVMGNPRFSNNAMDIGAKQSVWNGRYTKILGYGMECPDVSTNAFEATGGVDLNSGEITLLSRKELAVGKKITASATITGDGVLKVYTSNGTETVAEYTKANSPVAIELSAAVAHPQLRFVYEAAADDSGSAIVTSCKIPYGTVLTIR